MKSPQNYLIALLALTTIGAGWVAWRQQAEMAELRTAAMKKDERADLQKRVWDLEKLNRELRAQLAGQRGGDGEVANADRPPRDFGGRGGRGEFRTEGMGPQFGAMRDLMTKPEVQAMLNLQQQPVIDSRYATLFKNLNLQPEQIDRLKALLAERSTTVMDVMAAAREQGIDPRQSPDAFRKLVADAENEINNSIKSTIGDAGFAQLTSYEQTLPQRAVVNQLEQRLSYTNTPLTSTQAEQLVQILANNPAASNDARPAGPGPGRGPDVGGMVVGVFGPGAAPMVGMMEAGRGGTATVTPAAVTQAQTVLSPPQTQALQQIQQQQQSQQQLRQIFNDTMSANPPPAPPGSNPQPARKRPGG